MNCAWDAFISLVPGRMRSEVDRQGRVQLLELRLRLGRKPELVMKDYSCFLTLTVTQADICFCINIASEYSPWAASTVSHGYITAPGGHRIGICGSSVLRSDTHQEIRSPTSVCIRVARDFPDISRKIPIHNRSTLIIGKPGSGKTTLLRDIVRRYSGSGLGAITVVDERRELFPMYRDEFCFSPGERTDVISGGSKASGIECALRTMGPSCIAVDEITSLEDCTALYHAGWCGVCLLATAHAGSKEELLSRPVYKPLVKGGIFEYLLILREDKSFYWERMDTN